MSRADPPSAARGRPSAVEWMLIAAGLALVWRYAWIMDDAFIYARYADNAVLSGLGLVYNQGEFVEGYSSPLWMLWMLPLRALGLSFWQIWLGTGLLSFALSGWILVRVDRRLTPRPSSPAGAPPGDRRPEDGRLRVNLPLAFLATCYGVAAFYTSGLESPFVQLAATGYALYFVDRDSRLGQVLVGLSPLVRPELALPFLFALALGLYRRGRRGLRALLLPALLGLGTQLAWLLFRLYYYADLLPNTFYLKHEYDPAQGWLYFLNTFTSYRVGALLLGLGLAALWLVRRRGSTLRASGLHLGPRAAMLGAALLVSLYVIRIGGDAVHFRFLAFPFVLTLCATGGLLTASLHAAGRSLSRTRKELLCALASVLIAGLSLLQQPPQRELHAIYGAGSPEHVDKISDPGWHRSREKYRRLAVEDPGLAERRALARAGGPFRHSESAPDDACARAHWRYQQRIVHSLGLTDPFLARLTVPSDRPGHRYGLRPYARSLAHLYNRSAAPGGARDRGFFREAILAGQAPPWVVKHIDALDLVERKMFNRHDLGENLRLVLDSPRRIDVSP